MDEPLVPLRSEADELFARAQAGDKDAWDELFRTCHPKLVRAVRRRLGTQMRSLYDSTDFASDVWKSLVAKADRYEFATYKQLLGFLQKAAEQKIIDEYRRLRAQKNDINRHCPLDAWPGEDAGHRELPSLDPTPSKVAIAREGLTILRKDCNDEERRVIDLRIENYENAEIATRVGWNLRRLQRFLKALGDSWQSPAAGGR